MNDENKLNKIVTEFYVLKAKYEEKIQVEKARIRKNKETIHEKVSEYRKFKYKCVNPGCGKTGKMDFKIYRNQLKVSCPNEDNPCELLINVNLNIVKNYYIYYSEIKKKMENIKEKIIRKKLDLLFNLEEDDVVLQEFERIKEDFLEVRKELKKIQDTFDERLKYPHQNDETGELEKKYIRDEVDKLNKEVNNNIVEFNESLKKTGLSGDIMSFYITDILEKQNQIRQLRYYNGFKIIETKVTPKKETEYSVYSKEISYKNQEIVKENGKIIEYMRPKVKETTDDDSDVEGSPTEGVIKKPKHLTIKIPTETSPKPSGDEDSPVYIPGQKEPESPVYIPGQKEPESPVYNPTSPTYNPYHPTDDYVPPSPTFGPDENQPESELREINLDEITPEK